MPTQTKMSNQKIKVVDHEKSCTTYYQLYINSGMHTTSHAMVVPPSLLLVLMTLNQAPQCL